MDVFNIGKMEDNERYIAHVRKTGEKQSVKEHLEQVAYLSSINAGKIGLPQAGEIIGLLHDFGKYSEAFQSYIGSATGIIDQDADEYVQVGELKGKIDHSTSGAQYIWESFKSKNGQNRIAAHILGLCIASHHSGLIDCMTPEGVDNVSKRLNKSTELTFLNEVSQKAENDLIERINKLLNQEDIVNEIMSHLTKIATVKNLEHSIKTQFQFGLMIRMLYSCLIDADRQDTADFENPRQAKLRQAGNYIDWKELISRLELKLREFGQAPNKNKIDEIRSAISEACLKRAKDPTGVFTLTVPTGGGKTLASLRFALHHAEKNSLDRIFYVIPFTSIIDQNARVVREILEIDKAEAGRIVLEHHSNLVPEVQNWKNKLLTENWDAPIIFTTMVQLLETLFAGGTRSARRMHQLANSVIIFDEIQTLPVRTVHLFCNAINYLTNYCRSSVVLCTATQPLLNKVSEEKGRVSFDERNEIMPNVEKLFHDLKRVEVENKIKPNGWSCNEIAELATKQANETGSCLVIVNTKKNARVIYENCLKNDNIPVYHLSTSMCSSHRMEKLNEIRGKLDLKEPLICISTQLIEAGVDVDFGTVVRFVAGLDSIAQAAGRCNRNGRRSIGKVFVINPTDETIDSLPDIKIGKELTERVFREMANPNSDLPEEVINPHTMSRYFQYYFYNRAEEMSFNIDNGRSDNLLNMLSINSYAVAEHMRINNNKQLSGIYFRQSFKSAAEAFKALDAPTQGIVVPFKDGEKIIGDLFSQYAVEKQYELLRRAQRYTVNVFPNVLKKLKEVNAIKEVPEIGVLTLSDPRYYHSEFGLSTEIATQYETLIK